MVKTHNRKSKINLLIFKFFMRKLILALAISATMFSCTTESNEVMNVQEPASKATSLTAREVNNPYGEDLSDYPVLSVEDVPLTKEEEVGTSEAMGNGSTSRCKITSHVVSSYTGNHYYHADCSGTHWIIAWSPRSGWSNPWQESSQDANIWHHN